MGRSGSPSAKSPHDLRRQRHSRTHIDARIAKLAARQHGNVTRPQLLNLGLGPGAIKYAIAQGRLHPVYRGVYAVGRPATTGLELAAAAVLACGERAMLSHSSALWLWELGPWRPGIEVAVPVPDDRRPPGFRVHRLSALTRHDVRRRRGIRVTSAERALLDCAPRLSPRARVRTFNDALRAGHLKPSSVRGLLSRCGKHPGAKLLEPFVDYPHNPTRSDLEDAFLAFCERFDLPRPRINSSVAGHEVDAYFADERVIVELDSWTFHGDRHSFERDRDRDADALVTGIPTVRITWERLHLNPAREAGRLSSILAARR